MLIVYCDKCGARISEGDPQSQVVVGDHSVTYCANCAPVQNARPATPSPGIGRPKTAARIPVKAPSHAAPQRHTDQSKEKSSAAILIIGGAVLVIGLGLFVMKRKPDAGTATKTASASSDGGATPADRKPVNQDAVKTQTVEKSNPDKPSGGLFGGMVPGKDDDVTGGAKARAAQRLLNEAKQLRAKNMHDTPAYRDMLNNIVTRYRDTPEGAEASKLLAEVKIPTLQEDPNDKRKRIDLLKQVDPARDTVHGNWKIEGGNLGSDGTGLSRFKLPWTPPEEYDLRVKFVRQDGRSDVVIILMHRGQCGMLMIAGYENTCSGFDKVGDKRPRENPTGVNDNLENKREYAVVVQVRRSGIRAFRDGTLMCEYRNEQGNLALNQDWNMPPTLAVGSHDSPTTFTSIIAVHE